MKTVYFMRHGETELNKEGRMQGQSDVPLNGRGREQARRAGARFAAQGLRFDRVLSSPLSRALETAALASGRAPEEIAADARLLEMSYGPYEGLRFEDLGAEVFRFLYDPEHIPAPEGMEPIPALLRRTGDFWEELCADDAEERVLVVSHGVALRAVMRSLLGDAGAWSMPIENCVLYRCRVENGRCTDFAKVEHDDDD